MSSIQHQRQPSRTSCGLAAVAMLGGVTVDGVIGRLPAVRAGSRRTRKNHATNVAEVLRLLEPFGLTLSRRFHDLPPADRVTLVRIQKKPGRVGGWHWVVGAAGEIYDPALEMQLAREVYFHAIDPRRVSYYEVDSVVVR